MLYITFNDWKQSGQEGVVKKILGQVNALRNWFHEVYYTKKYRDIVYLMLDAKEIEYGICITRDDYVKMIIKWIEKYNIKETYVRYPFSNPWFINLLRYQKENGVRSILEIPGYPYEKTISEAKILSIEDRIYRKEIPKYIERIALISYDKEIWGIPYIPLFNGIDISDFPNLNREEKETNEIVFVTVSSMEKSYGYERLIEGMGLYYQQENVHRIVRGIFVGKGPEESYYRKLVEKYNLTNYVTFCGVKKGDDLNRIYEQVDIGISSLGGYKCGLHKTNPMKNAEYCARGIPIIGSGEDSRFPDGTAFYLQVPDDPSPLDMNAVIDFYDRISSDPNMHEKIIAYGKEKLLWDCAMKPIAEYLNEK